MKVKLVSQLLRQSMAESLKFCKHNLGLKEFSNVDRTVKFIAMFNLLFSILDGSTVLEIKKLFAKKIFNKCLNLQS